MQPLPDMVKVSKNLRLDRLQTLGETSTVFLHKEHGIERSPSDIIMYL